MTSDDPRRNRVRTPIMNLYAIQARMGDGEVAFVLAESDTTAMEFGLLEAAHDAIEGEGSLSADVYCVAENIRHVGEAVATDAPWDWAHPGVEENVAQHAATEAEIALGD
jgi:hypothetical protein